MGFAESGIAIVDGANLAIQGMQPSGIAAQGQTIWRAQTWTLIGFMQSDNSQTSAPFDTTGANLLVGLYNSSQSLTAFNESPANTWSYIGDTANNLGPKLQMSYVINPLTSTAHTFAAIGISARGLIMVFKSSRTATNSQFQVAANPSIPTLTLPAIPPSPNTLFVTSSGNGTVSAPASIDSGFTVVLSDGGIPGSTYPGGFAYKVSSVSESPTWNFGQPVVARALITSFN